MLVIVKHVTTEGPGIFETVLKNASIQMRIVELSEGEDFTAFDACSGIIVLGGPMNAYETKRYVSLARSEKIITTALERKIPLLGICLGAQLLAKVSGAIVREAPVEEIGWYKVQLTEEGKKDPLFLGANNNFNVFQWHKDSFDIPKEATMLVRGEECHNQAFRIGECAWGLQFHPEMTKRMIKEWSSSTFGIGKRYRLLCGYFEHQIMYLKHARIICDNFLQQVVNRKTLSV